MNTPKRGTIFTHQRYLTEDRKPAQMKVTAVRRNTVFFTYADSPNNHGDWYLPLDTWIERYGQQNDS